MVSAAPLLHASKITVLVNSGDGDRVRNVSADYTKSSGRGRLAGVDGERDAFGFAERMVRDVEGRRD